MTERNATELAIREASTDTPIAVFGTTKGFESAQRIAKALASSDMVPQSYQGNMGNCLVALDISQRTTAGLLAVMQSLHVIQGRPSWSSQFIIAALNSCGRFSPLRYRVEKLDKKKIAYEYWDGAKGNRTKKTGTVEISDQSCVAWCYDLETREVLEGPPATMEMAVLEGWYTKNDSKWKTMPDLMIRYRAAAFFGRLYAPEILMGMQTVEEVEDVHQMRDITPPSPSHQDTPDPTADIVSKARGKKAAAASEAGKESTAATRQKKSRAAEASEAVDAEYSEAADIAQAELDRMATGDMPADPEEEQAEQDPAPAEPEQAEQQPASQGRPRGRETF